MDTERGNIVATNGQFNFRMTPEEHATLTSLARNYGLKPSAMLRLLIKAAKPSPWPSVLFDGAVLANGLKEASLP